MQPYNKNLKPPSRELRSNMTDAETLLWSKLRKKQILDLQFYRQKPLLNFIVDFYCPKAKLVIECDGSQHHTEEGLYLDKQRDTALNELGLVVVRFDNRQILIELENVCNMIYDICQERLELANRQNAKFGIFP